VGNDESAGVLKGEKNFEDLGKKKIRARRDSPDLLDLLASLTGSGRECGMAAGGDFQGFPVLGGHGA